MLVRIFTLKFHPAMERFDDDAVQEFIKDKELVSVRDYGVEHHLGRHHNEFKEWNGLSTDAPPHYPLHSQIRCNESGRNDDQCLKIGTRQAVCLWHFGTTIATFTNPCERSLFYGQDEVWYAYRELSTSIGVCGVLWSASYAVV